MKIKLTLLSVLLLCLFVLTGCPLGPDEDYKTIRIGVFGDLESSFKAVFATSDFKQKFPCIEIELQSADFGGHHNRLVTQLAAGTGANDIECLEIGYLARFAVDGGFTNLAETPYNGIAAGKDLAPFALSNATTNSGELLAMPIDIAPAVLYYRKSIMDDLDVNMKNLADWDEYIEKARTLTRDIDGDGVTDQFALTHPSDLCMIPLHGGKGDWFLNNVPYEPKSHFMEVLELVQNVRLAGIDANFQPWSGDWMNSFRENKVVTMYSGSWLGGHFENWMCPELAGDWRITMPPGNVCSSYGGTYIGIPEQTNISQKQTAWEIIEYLCTSPEAQLLSYRTTDAFPVLTTVYDDPVMSEPVSYYGGQKVREIYRDIALNIPQQNVGEYDAIAADIFNKAIGSVIDDGVTPEAAYNQAKAAMQAWM